MSCFVVSDYVGWVHFLRASGLPGLGVAPEIVAWVFMGLEVGGLGLMERMPFP